MTTYKQSTKRYGKRKRIFYKKNVNNEDDDETNNVNNQKTQPSTPTRVTTPTAAATESETVSQKKIKNIDSSSLRSQEEPVTGYRLINLEILNTVFNALACPKCHQQKLILKDNVAKKRGLASFLFAFCSNCEYEKEFYTSSQQTDRSFDVNKRIVYAMRACGQGYSGIKQ